MSSHHIRGSRLGTIAKALSWLTGKAPLFIFIGMAASPVGPHMRWEYRYVDGYSDKIYTHCIYIGSRGRIIGDHLTPDCPFFVILDSRAWSKP